MKILRKCYNENRLFWNSEMVMGLQNRIIGWSHLSLWDKWVTASRVRILWKRSRGRSR